jgi:hypothetical protein
MRKMRRKPKLAGENDSPGYRTDVLDVLSRLLVGRADVRSGKMFGFPAFNTRGKLFACVYGDGVGLKLPEDMVRQLDGKPGITPFQPYGKPRMREWIHIRHNRASHYARDVNLFEASIKFVGSSASRGQVSRRPKRSASFASA